MVILETSMETESVTSTKEASIKNIRFNTNDNNNNNTNTIDNNNRLLLLQGEEENQSIKNEFEMSPARDSHLNSTPPAIDDHEDEDKDGSNRNSIGSSTDNTHNKVHLNSNNLNDHDVTIQDCHHHHHHDDGNDNDNDSNNNDDADAVEIILEENDAKRKLGIRLPQDPAIHDHDENNGRSDEYHNPENEDENDAEAESRTAPSAISTSSSTDVSITADVNGNDNADGTNNHNKYHNGNDHDNADGTPFESQQSRDFYFADSESFDTHGAKELTLAVTKEDEQEDFAQDHNDDTNDDFHSKSSPPPQQQQQYDAAINNGSHDDFGSSSSPLRISTGFNLASSSRPSPSLKSPMRCESPGMRKRKEELNKSQRSIRQLEEQLNLVAKEQPHNPAYHPSSFQSQQLHQHQQQQQLHAEYDDAESMSSTLTSTCSLLLHGSSRTLLTGSSSSNIIINMNENTELGTSNISPQRQRSPKHIGSPQMRNAFAAQRESRRLSGSSPRKSGKSMDGNGSVRVSSMPTPFTNNGSSVATPKASNNDGRIHGISSKDGTMMMSNEVEVEAKLAEQRRAHEDQIDEILEQLNAIETTYGDEIASLKARLSKKEIMEEGLLSSLTSYQLKNAEIKQKYELTLTNLDEAKQEFEAEHERYAALMRKMEQEKMKFVEAAREEVRSAAELQFASAQKTFIKLKQDYQQCLEERDTLGRQCEDIIEKVESLESKERAQEAMISQLMVEGADSEAKTATEKAEALKMKQEYMEKSHAINEKADRESAEAFALADQAIKEKEVLKKENSELQSLCEELMAIVEGRAK